MLLKVDLRLRACLAMCLEYEKSQPKGAYKARVYKIKKCRSFKLRISYCSHNQFSCLRLRTLSLDRTLVWSPFVSTVNLTRNDYNNQKLLSPSLVHKSNIRIAQKSFATYFHQSHPYPYGHTSAFPATITITEDTLLFLQRVILYYLAIIVWPLIVLRDKQISLVFYSRVRLKLQNGGKLWLIFIIIEK